MVGAFDPDPSGADVTLVAAETPCGVGHARLLKGTATRIPNSLYREEPGADRYRPDQRSPIANLFLAGDWTAQDYMASMEGAVQSARRAAQYVVDYLG